MEQITEPILQTWNVIAEMAPYLLFGFFISGILKVYVSTDFVKKHLGSGKWTDTLKATFIGIPLPLCSCGVIPVTATIRKGGASPQATLSFLTSTPQTGVDSILATWGLMGPVFTIMRLIVAFFTGFLGGIIAGPFSKKDTSEEVPAKSSCCCNHEEKPTNSCCGPAEMPKRDYAGAFKFAFLTLPGNIGKSLLIGLVIAGLFATYLKGGIFSGNIGEGILAYVVVTAISIPLYVCSTGSIPMAFALLQAGVSPGAALVFLVTGPATNAATISTMVQLLGRKAITIYLLVLTATTWLFAWLFDLFIKSDFVHFNVEPGSMTPGIAGHISAAVLLGVLFVALWKKRKTSVHSHQHEEEPSCCCGHEEGELSPDHEHSCCCSSQEEKMVNKEDNLL